MIPIHGDDRAPRLDHGARFADLPTWDGVQEIYQIDRDTSRVDDFATAVGTDRDHPAMHTIDNEITKFRQVHPVSRLEGINRKGVIRFLLARHCRSQVTTKDLNIDQFRHLYSLDSGVRF